MSLWSILKKTGVSGAHAFFVLGTVPIMSKSAPLDPAQFSLSRHGHPVQNGEIFFVSKSLGELPSIWNSPISECPSRNSGLQSFEFPGFSSIPLEVWLWIPATVSPSCLRSGSSWSSLQQFSLKRPFCN